MTNRSEPSAVGKFQSFGNSGERGPARKKSISWHSCEAVHDTEAQAGQLCQASTVLIGAAPVVPLVMEAKRSGLLFIMSIFPCLSRAIGLSWKELNVDFSSPVEIGGLCAGLQNICKDHQEPKQAPRGVISLVVKEKSDSRVHSSPACFAALMIPFGFWSPFKCYGCILLTCGPAEGLVCCYVLCGEVRAQRTERG